MAITAEQFAVTIAFTGYPGAAIACTSGELLAAPAIGFAVEPVALVAAAVRPAVVPPLKPTK